MRKLVKVLLPVVLLSFVLIGCGGKVNEDKPISEVETEAQAMSIDQLKAIVSKYEAAIKSKQSEIDKLMTEVQKIPITQMLGEEAKKLKNDIQNIGNSVNALTERLNIYVQELRNKM